MELGAYQGSTQNTAVYPGKGTSEGVNYSILALAGKTGELCNKWKKVLRDDNLVLTHERKLQMIDELGDVLWYVSAVATELNVTLDFVAFRNLEKLVSRREKNTLHGSGDTR